MVLGDYTYPIVPKSGLRPLPSRRVPVHHLHMSTLCAVIWCAEPAWPSAVLSARMDCLLRDPTILAACRRSLFLWLLRWVPSSAGEGYPALQKGG